MSPDRWILSSVWPQHIYSHLLVCTLVPWFPLSLSVGNLASVNGIHQWPVIRRWTTMFDLDTSIRIVGHVLIAVCVEDFLDWWHSIYATSLIVLVFMRFQCSWFDSSICQTFIATMEILICYISSAIMEIMVLCISSSRIFWCVQNPNPFGVFLDMDLTHLTPGLPYALRSLGFNLSLPLWKAI